jgi:hypothetical protein
MPEGLSAADVGREIAEHHTRGERDERFVSRPHPVDRGGRAVVDRRADRRVVELRAASNWSTQSSVALARASAARTKANRADLEAL